MRAASVIQTDTIAGRIAAVRAAIAAACARANRDPGEVRLVAVSKTQPAAAVVEAAKAGVRAFGENRVEEALRKIREVDGLTEIPLEWHMIGTVQSRKARYLTQRFALLHSLDSLKLAEHLNRILVSEGRRLDVLLQMNVSGEPTKQGWQAADWRDSVSTRRAVWDDIAQVVALPGLQVRGLMTMAPLVDDAEQTRPVFAGLRALRDALAADFGSADWSALSMGMTDDYPIAVEEGATLVRIGRAIFGPRS